MNILLTGGIGDCLSLESFWSPRFKNSIKHLYLACRNASLIKEIFSKIFEVPITILWQKRFPFFCFHNEQEVRRYFNLPSVQDWSIEVRFPQLNKQTFYGSSTLNQTLAECRTFPKPYIIIVPDSPNQTRDYRMNQNDWNKTIQTLEQQDKLGVILNNGEPSKVQHERLIDLTNQTGILESIEILKKADGYIGIDSFMSILAVQKMDRGNIRIKSTNPHLYRHKEVYYAPHLTFPFLGETI